MSKEQENLREKFIKETKSKLWAEDINEDVGFSDKYVEWLEKQLLIPLVVGRSEQLRLDKCPNKNNEEACRNGGMCPECS
jgi:hypothetical protein